MDFKRDDRGKVIFCKADLGGRRGPVVFTGGPRLIVKADKWKIPDASEYLPEALNTSSRSQPSLLNLPT